MGYLAARTTTLEIGTGILDVYFRTPGAPASYVRERVEASREAGVTNLQVSPAAEDPAATIRQLREWVS